MDETIIRRVVIHCSASKVRIKRRQVEMVENSSRNKVEILEF